MPADTGDVGDDVAQRDRLRGGRDPARADHRGKPVDERADGLEGRAACPDDHPGAQRRHRHRAGGQPFGGLRAAPEMRRLRVPGRAEPAQVDDLAYAGACGGRGDGVRGAAVDLLEVLGAEGVDEVDDDIVPAQDVVHGCGVGRVGARPHDAVLGLAAPA